MASQAESGNSGGDDLPSVERLKCLKNLTRNRTIIRPPVF